MPTDLGAKIKELRLRRGLDQLTLATRAEITREYLSRIESGNANPSIKVLRHLARELNVTEDVIVSSKMVSLDDERLWQHYDDQTKEFLLKESSMPYVLLAKKLSDNDVDEETIKAIELLISRRHTK